MIKNKDTKNLFKKTILTLAIAASASIYSPKTQANEETSPVCHFQLQQENICAQMTFATEPNTKTDSSFELKLAPLQKSAVMSEVLDIKADLWMDMGHGHGHGSAPVKIERVNENTYRATNVWFVMKGPWQIRLTIRTTAGETQSVYALNIVK